MKDEIHPKMYLYKRIIDAKLYIDHHYDQKLDLHDLSTKASFSKFHFARLFKKAFGKSPHQYLLATRIFAAKRLLRDQNSVRDTCFKVGFESVPSFITLFKKRVHLTPYEYQKRHLAREQAQKAKPLSFIPNCFVENYNWDK